MNEILINAAVLLSGIFIGWYMTVSKWAYNWDQPWRVYHKGFFYKVVRLDRWRPSMDHLMVFAPKGKRSPFYELELALQTDPEYAWSWHCNLAMMAQDAGAPHDAANRYAASFMMTTFNVDTHTRYIQELVAQNNEAGDSNEA